MKKQAQLALDGGPPACRDQWPVWPIWNKDDEEAVLRQLRTGGWGICPEPNAVSRFSERFAEAQGVDRALCCCNGTVALMIALRAVGVLPGDEVIMPAYTFMATATAALGLGAVPRIVDVDPVTYNLDPKRIEEAITPRTKAILPVHIAGLPADMDAINGIAKARGLKVVEDAAQAHLATYSGKGVGALGDAGTFSFQSSKNLTAGEGGMVTTRDPEVYRVAYAFHHCGRDPDGGGWYDHPHMGQNLRMGQLQAALLESQLERMAKQHRLRQENGRFLAESLSALEGIRVIGWPWPEKVTSASYHILIFTFEPEVFGDLTSAPIYEALRAEGVPCHGGYNLSLQDHDFYQDAFVQSMLGDQAPDFSAMETPVSRHAIQHSVWIKQHQLMAERPVLEEIVAAVEKVRDHISVLAKR